jgi:hypothetical protein
LGMRPSAPSPKNTSMVQPRWIGQWERIIFTGFHSPDSTSEATYLGIGPKGQGKIGPLTESLATQRTDVFVVPTTYGEYPMTKPMLSAIRWIDLDASLGSLCSRCRHSEFVHTESGPCLFSECKCPRLFPMVESAPLGESAGESAA